MNPTWLHRQLCSFEAHMALDQYVGQASTYELTHVAGIILRTGQHFTADLHNGSLPRPPFAWWAQHGAAMCMAAVEAWSTDMGKAGTAEGTAAEARLRRVGGISKLPPDDRKEILMVVGVTPSRLWYRSRRISRPRTGGVQFGPVREREGFGDPDDDVGVKAFANLPWGTEPLRAEFPPLVPCPHCGTPHVGWERGTP
jgi:hypothetical protein